MSYEEALAIRNEIGEKGTAAESRLALATVSLEEGRPAEAEGPAHEAVYQFRSLKISASFLGWAPGTTLQVPRSGLRAGMRLKGGNRVTVEKRSAPRSRVGKGTSTSRALGEA